VVLISHKLAEVLSVATHLVVMREGQVVFAGDPASVESRRLAQLIVGEREIKAGARAAAETGEAALSVRNLTVRNDQGYASVRNVSFDVRSGEVVVIAGVTGNGQNELMEAIGGLLPTAEGEVVTPRHPHRRGFAYIPARHLGTGLAPGLTIAENTLLGHHRMPVYRWWLRKSVVRRNAARIVERFGVSASLASRVSRLSGGNLQRVVLGRELMGEPRLIVADYPTRGLDLASAAEIRSALVEAAQSGAAVLLSSEELDESLAIATRVLVMNRGEIVSAADARGLDPGELGRLMTMGRD
jgi:simple sugar transport system ATP-binding protein